MHEYEIRLLKADRTTDTNIVMMYLTDVEAVRAARKIAEARPFEVWRDLECIYGRPFRPTSPGTWSPGPAA